MFEGRATPALVLLLLVLLAGSLCLASRSGASTISLAGPGLPYTQNFDTLANTGSSTTLPVGWALDEAGVNADGAYQAGDGSQNAGDTYSYGMPGSTERSLGMLQSGSLVPTIGAAFTNDIGSAITSLTIAYTGEQWRLGALSRTDRIDFQYSTDASSLTSGTWTGVASLDFVSPNTSSAVGALNGNAAANRTALQTTVAGLTVPNGATFWIRWTDFNATGADDGLAVDDFSLVAVPEPDVSVLLAAGLVGLAACERSKRLPRSAVVRAAGALADRRP